MLLAFLVCDFPQMFNTEQRHLYPFITCSFLDGTLYYVEDFRLSFVTSLFNFSLE